MVQSVNSNLNNYMVQNTGVSQSEIKQTLNKSTQAVTDTVESNALVNSAMGIDKNSVALALPLIGIIKFINNKLMSGEESKSLLGKVATFGDKISDKFNLSQFKGTGKKVSNFIKNNKYTKYFTDDYKAIYRCSLASTPKMSDKYARALLETLEKNKFDVKAIQDALKLGKDISALTDDLVKAADNFLASNPTAGKNQVSGLKNMLKASSSQLGKTGLGKAASKGALRAKEVMFSTSEFISSSPMDFIGDFFSIVFFAGVLIRAAKESKEAPKGEKTATFMHILSQDWAPLLVMKPATSLAYKLGGNKYRGMTVSARKSLENLIKTTNANKSLTKEGYKIAKMQQKLLLKGVDESKVAELATKSLADAKSMFKTLKGQGAKLNIIERILKKAGTVLDVGLDTIKSPSMLGKAGNKAKGFIGGFGRFVLIMFVLSSLLQKPITKLCHKIFGEPKSYLAKEKADDKKADDKKTDAKNTKNSQPEQVKPAQVSYPNTNIINQYEQYQKQQMQQAQNQQLNDVQTSTQASQPIAATNVSSSERYIPSIAVNYAQEGTTAADLQADAIIRSTDALMARAKKLL